MTGRGQTLFLLLRTGIILGLMLATVNWARTAGWGGLAFTLAPILAAGVLVGAAALWRHGRGWSWRFWGYSALSGALGMVIPNWLVFLTLHRDGVITAAVFYLLSPVCTQALTWMLGLDRLALPRVLGIVLGAIGALVLVMAPLLESQGGDVEMPLVGLLIPVSLAIGNIFRKRYMPTDKSDLTLAAGMLLGSGALFVPLVLAAGLLDWGGTAIGSPAPLLVQMLIMAVGFVSYFQFLRRVDPVYFSQLGYVLTLTGGLAGIVFFGESPGWHHGVSLALVAIGVWLVSRQGRSSK